MCSNEKMREAGGALAAGEEGSLPAPGSRRLQRRPTQLTHSHTVQGTYNTHILYWAASSIVAEQWVVWKVRLDPLTPE